MGKYTNWIPKPIRRKLWPYKAKLLGLPVNEILEAEKNKKDWGPLHETMKSFSKRYGADYIPTMLKKGWTTPGKMFDELGEIFSANRKLFLVGSTADVTRLEKKLEFIGVEIESAAIVEPGIKDIQWIAEHTHAGYTVVVAYQDRGCADMVVNGMIHLGGHFINVNLFYEANFTGDLVPGPEMYCGIFAAYTTGKVYLIHNNMLTSTICNLNCEYCLNYTPYIKHPKHFPLEELKQSADIYFSHIDRVGLFQLTGGEPLLYPHLQEILSYISEKYRNKIGILCFVTNGSIVPTDDFLDFCKREDIFIFLDDYVEAVPRIKPTFAETLEKIEARGIEYNCPKVEKFVKSFPPLRRNLALSEAELQDKYRGCHIGVQNLREGKLSSCTYHAFAVNAGLIPDDAINWFDMAAMTDDILSKRALLEFRCGFNQKGYVDWCRYCNGHITVNHLTAPAAEQVKGHLNWEIDSPTFLDD